MSDLEFKKRVLFIGIPDMAYVCLDGLKSSKVNIVGVLGPKKNHTLYTNFKEFVFKKELNFIEYDELDDENFIEKIYALNIDIAVVTSFNYKIPKNLLNAVKDGFINVHPSLLPKYRGANPYSIPIINGEKETGVTLHFMDENFDTGDIIAQEKLQIFPFETMGTLFNRTNFIAFNMLLKTLKAYEISKLPRVKQPEGNFEKCFRLSETDLIIDYNQSAIKIERFIRALNPFILASTGFRNTFVKAVSAEAFGREKFKPEQISSIIKIDDDKFYIATAEGLLAITSMQFGSFFTGTSKEFIKILGPKKGEKFYV